MSEEQAESHMATVRLGGESYDTLYASCFGQLWAPGGSPSTSLGAALRLCLQRHIDALSLMTRPLEDRPAFPIPSFAPASGEDDEEEEEE